VEEAVQGGVTGAPVNPQVIVRRALELFAAQLACAHNHPSGVAEPSGADRHLTNALKQALALVEVNVLDHFIVGGGSAFSFAERGLL
jgi:DNA repair protein RadC